MARTLVVEIIGDTTGLQRGLKKAEVQTTSFGTSVGKMAKGIGLAFGAVELARFGADSIKASRQFQQAMTIVHTQAGASAKEVSKLTGEVLKLAPTVGAGPEKLAAGLYHLESQGLRGAKAMEALGIAAKGAAVGNADLESVTDALGAVLSSGMKGVQNLNQVMGQLNATVGAGDMRMQELAEALGTGLAAKAKVAGVGIKDVSAALAVFGDNNVRGAEAGTQLGSVLRLMGAPSKAAEKALKQVGLAGLDLADTIRTKGLVPALELLQKKMRDAGLTASEQAQLLARAFGGRQAGGIQILLTQLDKLRQKEDQVAKGAGSFAGAWKDRTKDAQFQWDQFMARLDVLKIKLGDTLLPVVNDMLPRVSKALDNVKNALDALDKTVSVVKVVLSLGMADSTSVDLLNKLLELIQFSLNPTPKIVNFLKQFAPGGGGTSTPGSQTASGQTRNARIAYVKAYGASHVSGDVWLMPDGTYYNVSTGQTSSKPTTQPVRPGGAAIKRGYGGAGTVPTGGGGGKLPGKTAPSAVSQEKQLLNFAKMLIGTPYVWGEMSRQGVDCSGLVAWAYGKMGISLPHSTYAQVGMGKFVTGGTGGMTRQQMARLRPGDVIFTNYGEGGKAGPGHEALYVGGGRVEVARHRGTRVQYQSVADLIGGGAFSVRRFLGDVKPGEGYDPSMLFSDTGATGRTRWRGAVLRDTSPPPIFGVGATISRLVQQRIAALTARQLAVLAPFEARGGGAPTSKKALTQELAQIERQIGTGMSGITGTTRANLAALRSLLKQDLMPGVPERIKAQLDRIRQSFTDNIARIRAAQAGVVSAFQEFGSNVLSAFDAINAQWKSPTRKKLEEMQAKQALESAQKAYADAVNQYGADSQEAKDAARALSEAQMEAQARQEEEDHAKKVKADKDALEKRLDELMKEAKGAKTQNQLKKIQREINALLAKYGITPDAVQGALDWSASQTLFVQSMGNLIDSMNALTRALGGKVPGEPGGPGTGPGGKPPAGPPDTSGQPGRGGRLPGEEPGQKPTPVGNWPADIAAAIAALTASIVELGKKIGGNTDALGTLTAALGKFKASIDDALAGLGGFAGIGRQTGGVVDGTGGGDVVPALLEPGEYVLRKAVVGKLGRAALDRLNRTGRLPGYAGGGPIGDNNPPPFPYPLTSAVGSGPGFELWRRLVADLKDQKRGAEAWARATLMNPFGLPTPAAAAIAKIESMSALVKDAALKDGLAQLTALLQQEGMRGLRFWRWKDWGGGRMYGMGVPFGAMLPPQKTEDQKPPYPIWDPRKGGIPSAAVGGTLLRSGILYGHKGETIQPAIVAPLARGGTIRVEVPVMLDGREVGRASQSFLIDEKRFNRPGIDG